MSSLHARLAAEEVHPLADRVVGLLLLPLPERPVTRLSRRTHEHEAVHERVVDRPLEPVPLAQTAGLAANRAATSPSLLISPAERERASGTGGSTTVAAVDLSPAVASRRRKAPVPLVEVQVQRRHVCGRHRMVSPSMRASTRARCHSSAIASTVSQNILL